MHIYVQAHRKKNPQRKFADADDLILTASGLLDRYAVEQSQNPHGITAWVEMGNERVKVIFDLGTMGFVKESDFQLLRERRAAEQVRLNPWSKVRRKKGLGRRTEDLGFLSRSLLVVSA